MFKQTAFALLAASCLTVACSDDTTVRVAGLAGPSGFPGAVAPFASINPTFLSPQLNSVGVCPLFQPFRAPLNLIIQAAGDVSLTVSEVRMQFIDSSSIAGPQVTLAAPALTRQFGTALVQARGSRSFPFDFGFGCGTGRTGTIVVLVRARHDDGRDDSAEMRVRVN